MGRSLKYLIDTGGKLEAIRVGFQSVTERIDTTTSGGKPAFGRPRGENTAPEIGQTIPKNLRHIIPKVTAGRQKMLANLEANPGLLEKMPAIMDYPLSKQTEAQTPQSCG